MAQDHEGGMPFFVREKEHIKVFNFNPANDISLEKQEPLLTLPTPKAAMWSPNGLLLALAEPSIGVQVVEIAQQGEAAAVQHDVPNSSKTTQTLQWSPDSQVLVTVAPAQKGSSEPNVLVYVVPADLKGGGISLCASFSYPKLERDKKIFQWSPDSSLCARLCVDGGVHILAGSDIGGSPLTEITLPHAVQNFEFAPVQECGGLQARLTVFVPDVRDDMQRVVGPAEVTIWELTKKGSGDALQVSTCRKAVASVASGQIADLQWNAHGTALLAHCQTDVDETGASYYGGSKLLLVSSDGGYQNDLTDSEEGSASGTSVQAVAWSPTRDEFILIQGFQPARATLWSWDAQAQKPSLAKVLLEKAHRNTIRFNHFGSLVCLAGFGNLAGDVDFFGRRAGEKCDFCRVSSCQANCTVSAEWSTDGRHFLTAVLAPRMRVDNGVGIWSALTGGKVCQAMFEELFDAQWRPEVDRERFSEITTDEVEQAVKELASRTEASGGEKKKQAYRPPKARGEGGGSVAAMMRGEMAPDPSDDRRRKPREPQRAPARRESEDGAAGADEQDRRHSIKDGEQAASEASAAQPRSSLTDASPTAAKTAARRPAPPADPVPVAPASTPSPAPKAYADQPVSGGYPAAAKAPAAQPPASALARDTAPRKATQPWQPSNPAHISSLREPQVADRAAHGQKLPCPDSGWQYVDPKQNIQGPFTLMEMQQWHSMGYFRPTLQMRCDPSDRFVPFAELFPHPMIPFQSYPKRPGGMGFR